MTQLLAVESMKNLHVALVAVVALGAVLAVLVRALRARKRSAEQSNRDQGR
jgi:hypothetical protein